MSRLSWQNDPHGCFADAQNELYAEAAHAAHLEGECQSRECEWCEAEKQAELEGLVTDIEKWQLPPQNRCGKCEGWRETDSYCVPCDGKLPTEANEQAEALVERFTCPRCDALIVPGFYCIRCGYVPPKEKSNG